MPDRTDEIRARLAAVRDPTARGEERMVWVSDKEYVLEDGRDRDAQAFHQNAADDIAWLLSEVERLEAIAAYADHEDGYMCAMAQVECECGLEALRVQGRAGDDA